VYRLIHRDYRELIPLWRYRYRPQHASVQRLRGRKRDLRMTIDARLQVRLARALQAQLARSGLTRGALVVMDPSSGDVLASVSVPAPAIRRDVWEKAEEGSDPALLDRARYGVYPPGSTFKIVTAAAALTRDTGLRDATFACRRLPDGRVGNYVRGWSRPIRDDELDAHPHGVVDMQEGMIVSCNAYFAQLGLRAGASALHAMAHAMDITVAHPDTADRLRNTLPQAAYGQGEVLATPFKLTRATAAIAAGGAMPYGRWVGAAEDRRNRPPVHVMSPEVARRIASYMRNVVVRGTGRALAGHPVPIAGKTGTAEVDKGASHAWFAGFAPYGTREGRRIAFTILVENGGYGGRTAAPLAAEIVTAARQYGYVTP
jgi:cell division protein FtsI/penicillin-binding protein 2